MHTQGAKAEEKSTGAKRRGSVTRKDRKSISGEDDLLSEDEKQRLRVSDSRMACTCLCIYTLTPYLPCWMSLYTHLHANIYTYTES